MNDAVLPDDHDARIARLDAMIAQAKHLPSLPMLAARLEQLTQTIETLTARVAALEQECEALRQRELIQLWDREA
jgi:cell division protein FtsB